MQVAIFCVGADDARGLEDLNRFLRGHRVLTLDRQFREGSWSFCVTYQTGLLPMEPGRTTEKIDYRAVLDPVTFARFARLRDERKVLAEKEALPAYAVFTNEQIAEIARRRCTTAAELGKIDGIGTARIEKYGAAVIAALTDHDQQQTAPGADRGPGQPA